MSKKLIHSIITILVILIVYSYESKRYNTKSTWKIFNFNKNNGKYLSISTFIASVILILGFLLLSSYKISHIKTENIDTSTIIRFIYISIALYMITNIITIMINCIYNLVIKIKNKPTSFYDDLDTNNNASLIKSINDERQSYYKNNKLKFLKFYSNKYDEYIYNGTKVLYEMITLYMIIIIIINILIEKLPQLAKVLFNLLVLVPAGYGIYNTIIYYLECNNKISSIIEDKEPFYIKIYNAMFGKSSDKIGYKENDEELLFLAIIVITLSIFIIIIILLYFPNKKKYKPIVDNYNYLINKI